MTRKVHERFPFSAAGLILALVISGTLAHAQSNIQGLPICSRNWTVHTKG